MLIKQNEYVLQLKHMFNDTEVIPWRLAVVVTVTDEHDEEEMLVMLKLAGYDASIKYGWITNDTL